MVRQRHPPATDNPPWAYMIRHEGEVLTRRQLLKDVWDKNFDTNTNVVDVYVRYLRQKIDEDFAQKHIQTIVGQGYTFKK